MPAPGVKSMSKLFETDPTIQEPHWVWKCTEGYINLETGKLLSPEAAKSFQREIADRSEETRSIIIEDLAREYAGKSLQPATVTPPKILTSEAIAYFFEVKSDKSLKQSSLETYHKRLNSYNAAFEFLPLDTDVIRRGYWSRYEHMSVRYKQAVHDLLIEFYSVIKRHYALPFNPWDEIGRPDGNGNPTPHPLNSQWLAKLMSGVETDYELAVLHMGLGAGWRPQEYRYISALDVRQALDRELPVIFCSHGKERPELTPLLPETLKILARLAPASVADHDLVLRSRRFRHGAFEPMGEKAALDLVYGLYRRAGIPTGIKNGFTPYDLRDTFATEVYKVSRSWDLMERLLRHKEKGQGRAYARYPLEQLCEDLSKYSPLRFILGDKLAGNFNSPPSPPETRASLGEAR
jgi:site-specific recombinase XerC